MFRALYKILIPAVLMSLFPTLGHTAKAVQVFVNGKSVDTAEISVAALYDKGSLPVRETVKELGGEIDWDKATGALTISGPSGVTVARIGSRDATIRGTKVYLPGAPYLFGGTAYAPIILFSRTFDMALLWDPWAGWFRWFPTYDPRRPYGNVPPPIVNPRAVIPAPGGAVRRPVVPTTRIVVGEVVRIFPTPANRRIVVLYSGREVTYTVPGSAMILRGPAGGRATESPLGGVAPGDKVTIRFDEGGNIVSIRSEYREIRGRVESVEGGMIALDSGVSIKPGLETDIILEDNIRGEARDIRVGDTVVASASPLSGRVFVIRVLPSAGVQAATPEGGQVILNTAGPLRAGDVLVAWFRGRPQGTATFTIPGIRENIPMTEIQPGVYEGQYEVRPGDILMSQAVTVTLTDPEGVVFRSASRQAVTIRTEEALLPVITSPRQGAQIISPLVVTGLAGPRQLVRVTVEYRAVLQNMLPIRGIAAVEEVVAGSDGIWRTPEMAAVAPFGEDQIRLEADFGIFTDLFRRRIEPPIRWIITATIIGPDGRGIASYTIETTKEPGWRVEGF